MTLWLGNDAVLKSSSQWQLNEFWKLNDSVHELFIFKILRIYLYFVNIVLDGRYWDINPFPHNDTFWRPWETNLLKTLGKGEIARYKQCFLPVWITLPFSSNLKLLFAKFFSLEETKTCRLVMG